jgi:hypothetical protein
MHSFDDLIYRSTVFNLNILEEANSKIIIEELQISGSTVAVKNLQMIQLQKVIIAVGMFSLFESILQDGLTCGNGFEEAKNILTETGNTNLKIHFQNYISAINVLKHGKGKSYNALVAKSDYLPFRIKLEGEYFFDEGDLSEVSTLIEVDDKFVLDCAQLIETVSQEIRKARPDFIM